MNEFPPDRHLPQAADTLALGEEIGQVVRAGEVIALKGNLGAGKTTLTQGILKGLSSQDEVTSPTFSLMQEYRSGRLEVFHFDFYRVEHAHELEELGWDDFLERGGLVIVEWPERYPDLLPSHSRWCLLEHLPEGRAFSQLRSWK